MKKILAIAVVACLALTLVACGGLDVTKLTMPTELALETGQTSKLEITYNGEAKAEDVAKALEKAAVVWTSSDEAVATVDASGTVTAVAAGEADVTAASKDGKTSLTCKVTVTEPVEPEVEEVEEADDDAVKMAVDNTEGADAMEAIKATGVEVPEEIVADQLTWTSSDENVATVDATGHVTPVGVGTCVITATGKLADGQDWTAQCCFSIQETVDEEPAAEATDKDTEKTDGTTTGKTDGKTDSDSKSGSTTTGGETASGGKDNSGSSATGNENASGGNNNSNNGSNNNTPAPTPAPAEPTPAPDTGNNAGTGNNPNAGGAAGQGDDYVIPGDGSWAVDGGNAAPPEDAPMAPPPVEPAPAPETPAPENNAGTGNNPNAGGAAGQGADYVIPGDGSWAVDGGNAAPPEDAPMAPPPVF